MWLYVYNCMMCTYLGYAYLLYLLGKIKTDSFLGVWLYREEFMWRSTAPSYWNGHCRQLFLQFQTPSTCQPEAFLDPSRCGRHAYLDMWKKTHQSIKGSSFRKRQEDWKFRNYNIYLDLLRNWKSFNIFFSPNPTHRPPQLPFSASPSISGAPRGLQWAFALADPGSVAASSLASSNSGLKGCPGSSLEKSFFHMRKAFQVGKKTKKCLKKWPRNNKCPTKTKNLGVAYSQKPGKIEHIPQRTQKPSGQKWPNITRRNAKTRILIFSVDMGCFVNPNFSELLLNIKEPWVRAEKGTPET